MSEDNLEIRLVRSLEDFRTALMIRFEVFGNEGYLDLKKYMGYEQDEFDVLPQTAIFIGFVNGNPAGTVRLVMDSEYGFPLDKECASFKSQRKEGRTVAEGSRFAVRREFRGTKSLGYGLLKADIIYGFRNGVTDIVSVGNLGTKRGFNVAEQVFMKIGYAPVDEPFYHPGFDEMALPMVLRIEGVAEPFKSFMQEDSGFIEAPWNQYPLR